MRNGKLSRRVFTPIIAQQRSWAIQLCCMSIICLISVAGCHRFDRLAINNYDLDEKFSVNDIQGAEKRGKDVKPRKPSSSTTQLDRQHSRIRDGLKRGSIAGTKIGDDQAPKANAIVETDHPEADLNYEIGKLPPDLKKMLQEYLADAKSGKSNTALATADNNLQNGSQPKADQTEANLQSDAPAVRRSINDMAQSTVDSAVVPASTFPTVNTEKIALRPQPVVMPEAEVTSNELLSKTIAALEKEINENLDQPEDVRMRHESNLRILQLAAGKVDESVRPIPGLDLREQEYMRHQIQALYEATNPSGIPVRRKLWSTVMESQREATGHLAAISDLEVQSAEFCTSVDGYGLTKKFANYQFKPDQDALLYCELENVDAESVNEGFETQLRGRYEIIDNNGQRVADQVLPIESEICKNHRRDYFIVYRIYMPMQIVPGTYQFRLTIEDMKAKKFGQTMLDFQIVK